MCGTGYVSYWAGTVLDRQEGGTGGRQDWNEARAFWRRGAQVEEDY